MQCLILAGGLGTRIASLAGSLPKHLIPVAGEPFAVHQLRWLHRCGVREVIYSIGHLGDQIQQFVGDGSRFGLNRVDYVEDGPTRLGTGGPVRRAYDEGMLHPRFLVVYGDSYLPLDVGAMDRAFAEQDRPAIMSVLLNQGRFERSNARFAEGRVTVYRKGSSDPTLDAIDYGASILTPGVAARLPHGPSALESLYETLSDEGLLAAYPVQQRFYEVGSPEGLADLERLLALG